MIVMKNHRMICWRILVGCIGTMVLYWPFAGQANAPDGRYNIGNSVVVFDNVTKLTWQRMVDAKEYVWSDARQVCDSLNAKKLGEYTDWRMPTIAELLTIVDTSKVNPAIDETAFPGPNNGYWFWSSTGVTGNPSDAWVVRFGYGYGYGNGVGGDSYVRCVR